MANNTISQVEINGTTYDLLDANTLSALDSLKTRVTTLENSVANKASTADSIKNITRSGTTFTATRANGTTFTFNQQDNNTTYGLVTTSANGLMSAADKVKLNNLSLRGLSTTGIDINSWASGSGQNCEMHIYTSTDKKSYFSLYFQGDGQQIVGQYYKNGTKAWAKNLA